MSRRVVKLDDRFLGQLDEQLGSERGPEGRPSSTDFLVIELPVIVELFATSFEALAAPIPDRPDYRVLLGVGRLVPRLAITGVLAADGSVNLVDLDIDFEAGWSG